MGDDLSLDPYVSGNFEAFAPPKVSNIGSWRSGVVGRSVAGFSQGLVRAGNSHVPNAGLHSCACCPARGRVSHNQLRFSLLGQVFVDHQASRLQD
jgi:hypothetical protein